LVSCGRSSGVSGDGCGLQGLSQAFYHAMLAQDYHRLEERRRDGLAYD
jgi:hypothetical protein